MNDSICMQVMQSTNNISEVLPSKLRIDSLDDRSGRQQRPSLHELLNDEDHLGGWVVDDLMQSYDVAMMQLREHGDLSVNAFGELTLAVQTSGAMDNLHGEFKTGLLVSTEKDVTEGAAT